MQNSTLVASDVDAQLALTAGAGLLGVVFLWLRRSRREETKSLCVEEAPPAPAAPDREEAAQPPQNSAVERTPAPEELAPEDPTPEEQPPAEELPPAGPDERLPMGARVQIHGLQKAAELNGAHGVLLRFDGASGRYVVRREVSLAAEASTVTVRAANLVAAAPLATLAAVQQLVDTAPSGARVTLARGTIAAEEAPSEGASGGEATADAAAAKSAITACDQPRKKLVLRSAISLVGMGGKTGGTTMQFDVEVDGDVRGECIELCGVHILGTLDVAPWDVQRVRLVRVSVSAPLGSSTPAVMIDEIGLKMPTGEAGRGRVLLDEVWVRGGKSGVMLNAVGGYLRNCRVQDSATYGVHANALFAIENCTIGHCAKSGRGGGILARGKCVQVREATGLNENRVQRDAIDKGYGGYSDDCQSSCIGRCTCTALYAFAMAMTTELITWDYGGTGKWRAIN